MSRPAIAARHSPDDAAAAGAAGSPPASEREARATSEASSLMSLGATPVVFALGLPDSYRPGMSLPAARSIGDAMVKEEIKRFAQGPNFAAMTTLDEEGNPATQIMWVDADDEFLLINTEIHRAKFRNVSRDPRVAISIWNAHDPYEYVEVRGTV